MSDLVYLVLVFLGGCLLGAFYFGGLWITVKRMPHSRHPQAIMLLSFVLRLMVTLAVFYLLCRDDWRKWAMSLIGFMMMRTVSVRITGKIPEREEA